MSNLKTILIVLIIGIAVPVVAQIFGLFMEADQTLYKIGGIENETTQSKIRIIAFIITILMTSVALLWLIQDYLKARNNIIYEVFVKSIFQAFFETAPITEKDKIFRVNLYKFYKTGTISWRWEKFKRWLEYRKTNRRKDRRLENNTDYLLCHTRYGRKHGLQISNTTTYPFKVKVDGPKPVYRLFTGEVYKDRNIITKIALDNPNINEIVKKIPAPDANLRNTYISLLNESVTKNYDDLLTYSIDPTHCLNSTEQSQLKDFMEKTNTLALDLFDINEGVHCNHFMGFKIFKNTERLGDTLWGVVTIDALEPSGRSFYNLVGVTRTVQTNPQWLEIMLKSFSKQLSNAISRL